MPKVDYKCNKCNTIIEKSFSINDDYPVTIQCTCGDTAKRVWDTFNFTVVDGTPHHLTERSYYKETDDVLNEFNSRKKWEMPDYNIQKYKKEG